MSLFNVADKNSGTYTCKVYIDSIKIKAESSVFVGGETKYVVSSYLHNIRIELNIV